MQLEDLEKKLEKIHEDILCLPCNEKQQVQSILKDMLEDISSTSICSRKSIEEFVNQLLKDEDINIGLLPDCIEKKIYLNVFTLLVNLLDKLLSTSEIRLLNHKITFDIKIDQDKKLS